MESLKNANQLVGEYEATLVKPRPVAKGMKLYTGVDLGTAYIVLAVVDDDGKPVAGAYKTSFEEAERIKTDPARQRELFPVVKPVMQKVAAIIRRHIRKFPVEAVYLAGGTSCFPGIEQVVQAEVGIATYKPENPFLVTPLGIALWVQKGQVVDR